MSLLYCLDAHGGLLQLEKEVAILISPRVLVPAPHPVSLPRNDQRAFVMPGLRTVAML